MRPESAGAPALVAVEALGIGLSLHIPDDTLCIDELKIADDVGSVLGLAPDPEIAGEGPYRRIQVPEIEEIHPDGSRMGGDCVRCRAIRDRLGRRNRGILVGGLLYSGTLGLHGSCIRSQEEKESRGGHKGASLKGGVHRCFCEKRHHWIAKCNSEP